MEAMLIADAGIPMIAGYLPTMWLALIPVILFEAAIGKRIAKISFRRAVFATTIANCFSTLLGIPLTWMVLALIEGVYFGAALGLDSFGLKVYAVTIQSPWLIPYEKDLFWMVPVAAVVLAIPFWFVSVLSEYFILRRVLPEIPSAVTWRWMWIGNSASYLLLPLLALPMALLLPNAWLSSTFTPITDYLTDVLFKLWDIILKK